MTTSSIRTFVREGTEVYMDKLEGTNTWADLLATIGQGRNSAVMGGLTRVFVHELVNSYLNRPSASSRYFHDLASPNALPIPLCGFEDALTGLHCILACRAGQLWQRRSSHHHHCSPNLIWNQAVQTVHPSAAPQHSSPWLTIFHLRIMPAVAWPWTPLQNWCLQICCRA